MKASNIHYEMAEKARALNCGGIGAIHLMVNKLGLRQEIDSRLDLLKKHLPYHESDHVLNLTYNALLDGVRLEDIELRRNDEAFLDGLGAQRIPDPTTSGDFTGRFGQDDILDLLEIANTVRQRVWNQQPGGFLTEALIDTDGTIAATFGECKGGLALSYKGIWGYAPLVISLAKTNEVLYLVNPPGNVVSHEGCVPWIDRAIKLVAPHAGQITLRGDTDFTLTGELDRWDGQGIKFIFGMEAHCKVVKLAEALPEEAWKCVHVTWRMKVFIYTRVSTDKQSLTPAHGLCIVGGLAVAQVLTLFCTPVFYIHMEYFQERYLDKVAFFNRSEGEFKEAGAEPALMRV